MMEPQVLEDDCFDTFNVPAFVGFIDENESVNESLDMFFDVRKDVSTSAPTPAINKSRISSGTFYSPLEEDFVTVPTADNGRRFSMRKSLSVGNLIMFSEQDRVPMDEICENIDSLHVSSEEGKAQETTLLPPNLSKTNDNPSNNSEEEEIKEASRLPSNLIKTRNHMLHQPSGQDYLNKLAQPKRYASVENLKPSSAEKYVPLAEAVKQFHKRTPDRFRSKPKPSQHLPLFRTVAESPALRTKARSKPCQPVLSHEEREAIEFQNHQKFKIKARPVNKKILLGPLKPTVTIEKKHATVPKPFNLTVPPKKIVPESKPYEFHARPVPRSVEKASKPKEIQPREITKPLTPTFMKQYKPPRGVSEEHLRKKVAKEERPRSLTKPEPFNFELRDREAGKKRQQLMQKILDEEKRARQFHAKPLPPTYKKTDSARSEASASEKSNKENVENLSIPFKARPPVVLYKEPFVPAKTEKPLTQAMPFQLNSELRSSEREEFDRERRSKEEEIENFKKMDEERQLKEEQEEILRIRKETLYKAKPIRKYKEVIIQPSGKVTVPVSPKFQKRRQD